MKKQSGTVMTNQKTGETGLSFDFKLFGQQRHRFWRPNNKMEVSWAVVILCSLVLIATLHTVGSEMKHNFMSYFDALSFRIHTQQAIIKRCRQ